MREREVIHVAAGVILNEHKEVLLALRPAHKHQGGLWEFPGGKVEAGEKVEDALARELMEELDLQVLACEPLLLTEHDYGDKQVCLDVWLVTAHAGEAVGREGQQLAWVPLAELPQRAFPAANLAIVERLLQP
ncbi:MAG TPA: 8-oxo-dGTP diphosphatase MutT [Pseudomonadaceae bacterium]|nr:8-oxo-dGTP diphosphatase MutT [Pseudomonadaceae bacterium]